MVKNTTEKILGWYFYGNIAEWFLDLLPKNRLICVNETPKDETLSTSLLSGYEA
jgi:hypothetical protein